MRALSTRLTTLQREMNPQLRLTGTNFDVSKVATMRKYVVTAPTVSGVLNVTSTTLPLPDGAKVLKVRLRNLTGRTLKVSVPAGTGLVLNGASGDANLPFGGFSKFDAKPFSRFPTLTLNVPDSLAAPLDSAGTATLFSVTGDSGSAADVVELTATVLYYV